ncbi:vacuolar protein sorting-associated protein, Vps52/Sac2 family protein [Rhizoctonia solani]|uniref:Vacuolar protein sorting-associated protein, Vps52/Sac2 family protein n=1 Tax=Rhizoctonia solani TaxID=456999 RepID=A0A8H8NNX1_9AGAM|nr:vacuolar protein sorting-associated protein, Vps52/Sac2 family protein [Rhizoctonia solani]QRW15915.1 vacuolar protein sorting-associated protein, Vps52/Sac2 family protein [Rhizoctonia solani]
MNLLDSLEGFLSKFQSDLSAVSGQITDLQSRSRDFDMRLKSRQKIERPLSQLLQELCVPPDLATTILDTNVSESWIPAIAALEEKLIALEARSRVRASKDCQRLRKPCASLPLGKYEATSWDYFNPSEQALEFQHAYIAAARLYYETGFRRYARSLGYLRARTVEKSTLIGTLPSDGSPDPPPATDRLQYANLEGPGVTLAYMADDAKNKEPPEAAFRSLLLVLLDNATAEYAFLSSFFRQEPNPPRKPSTRRVSGIIFEDPEEQSESGGDSIPISRTASFSIPGIVTLQDEKRKCGQGGACIYRRVVEADYGARVGILPGWKQRVFIKAALEPAPPLIPLLTMIRLNENVYLEAERRGCGPLETFLLGQRLAMWPLFQKDMGVQVDSLKKLAENAVGGYLSRSGIKDSAVQVIINRYASLFIACVRLSSEGDETMLFSNVLRLRQELAKLIINQSKKIKDSAQSSTYLSTTYELLLSRLSVAGNVVHPRAQSEASHWRELEEEARRRIGATRR